MTQISVHLRRSANETYSVGDVLNTDNHGLGILAQVGPGEVAFIVFNSGNRLTDAVHVGDIYKMTPTEVRRTLGIHTLTFRKLDNVAIFERVVAHPRQEEDDDDD